MVMSILIQFGLQSRDLELVGQLLLFQPLLVLKNRQTETEHQDLNLHYVTFSTAAITLCSKLDPHPQSTSQLR